MSKKRFKSYASRKQLSGPSFPMPLLAEGTKIKVYLGTGFSTAYVVKSFQDKCIVRLSTGNRQLTVLDARSIKRVES